MSRTVEVALVTYNGIHYIEQFVKSLLEQSYTDWRLVISDDGSTDGTLEYLECLACEFPDKIVLTGSRSHVGVRGNINRAVNACTGDVILLADQDDVWFPEKIDVTVRLIESVGVDLPVLVFTDAVVGSESGEVLAKSLMRWRRVDAESGRDLRRLLVQNVVSGCTVGFTRRLWSLAGPVPPAAVMHDWWLALGAAAIGQLVYLDRATLLYRLHGANTAGVRAAREQLWETLRSRGRWVRERNRAAQRQAAGLVERLGVFMGDDVRELVSKYALLGELPPWRRREVVTRLGIGPHGAWRRLAFYLFL